MTFRRKTKKAASPLSDETKCKHLLFTKAQPFRRNLSRTSSAGSSNSSNFGGHRFGKSIKGLSAASKKAFKEVQEEDKERHREKEGAFQLKYGVVQFLSSGSSDAARIDANDKETMAQAAALAATETARRSKKLRSSGERNSKPLTNAQSDTSLATSSTT